MDLSSLVVFATAFVVAAVSPGPAVTTLVAQVLARGSRGAAGFSLGIVLGDLAWFTVAALGLAVIATALQPLFLSLKYAGAAYLLFIAWRTWRAPPVTMSAAPVTGAIDRTFLRDAVAGLTLGLGNPKAMLFYLALLPSLIDLQHLTVLAYLEVAALIVLLLSGVLGGYALLAVRARGLFGSARAVRRMTRGSAVVMAGAAVAVASN